MADLGVTKAERVGATPGTSGARGNHVRVAPKSSRRRSVARYYAFLSYSHDDQDVAEWLHEAVEQFRVPRKLVGRLTENGVVPRRLTPVFRDRGELAASDDLSEEIEEALAGSRFMIVLCSPAAVKSRWTNAEIAEFKRLHPEAEIFAAIIAGEPFASEMPGRENEECFPAALLQKYDRRGRPTGKRAEPIAADLRDEADGRRLGMLKIVAGMLGVGLDELVQRETARRHRRWAWLAAASVGGMAITSTLAVTAIQSRDAASDERREAEALIGFMLGDLRDRLEPLGRLDVLDSVGARALAYYEKQDKESLSDESLAQRSRALTLMGQVASARGNLDGALRLYREAFASTAELLRRQPEDPQRLFDHAQNVFYVGDIARQRRSSDEAEAAMREYKRLAARLIATDPSNPEWQMEGIYADLNIGTLLNDSARYSEAAEVFERSLGEVERLAAGAPANVQYRKALISQIAWLGEAREKEGRLKDGLAQRERQIALLRPFLRDPKSDTHYKREAIVGYWAAGRLNSITGDVERGLDQLRTAVSIGDRLLNAEPDNTDWAAITAGARLELARLTLAPRYGEEAAVQTTAGCGIAERLVAKDASVLGWRLGLRSLCLELKVRTALKAGSTAEARAIAEEMVRLAKGELVLAPSADAQLALANAELMRGLTARAAGDRDAASLAFRAAAAAWPNDAPDRPLLKSRKVLIFGGLGRNDAAKALAGELDRIGYRDPTYLRDRSLVSA